MKIYSLVAVLFAVTTMVGATGISALRTSNDRNQELDRTFQRAYLAEKVNRLITAVNAGSRGVNMAQNQAEVELSAGEVKRFSDEMMATLAEWGKIVPATERPFFDSILAAAQDYRKLRLELARVGVTQGAKVAQAKGSDPAVRANREALQKALSEGTERLLSLLNPMRADLERVGQHAEQRLQTIAVAGLLIGIVLAVWIGTFLLARPLGQLARIVERMAAGELDIEIPAAKYRDEIGSVARAVEAIKETAFRKAVAEAEMQRAVATAAEAQRVRLTAEAEAAAQMRLREATSGLAAGLKRLAAGDLAFQLTEPFAADFEALRHDLNQAVAQLGRTLASVAHAATLIDGGSREISTSATDLSRRSEQQAASLEQTAAALDQITVNVSNSSKRADEARGVASQANVSAAQSGAVVANAVDAMQRIEQSSSQISNIIGVIDQIAFQTNLLALNAGVEAARAGEAGKGFAVVAQEVRELAQRSANAAKEIKGLIRNSSAEVENGVKLVRDTGEALETIGGYVETINQHMDAIATSAREQSVGLAEINTAINQMDQVTQQNAAMVEDTTAATANLAAESASLRDLIGQFKLQSHPPQTAMLRERKSAMAATVHKASMPARVAIRGNTALKHDEWTEF
ncbi:HAMP domain-containing protein [Agrobacterium rhizogenes]|uniref:HAMP domain-containing methyl-accepting chemotaxis protein n=1 Tax=Rhizobium rhizogenes TaxID=359 RepID=UPI001571FBED|nr:methyl-accepting chemotaxis protein [Rhizobium rhizogenes]NTH16751.1 HAMP domain-containing protein [Rhizobium rhizogenes]